MAEATEENGIRRNDRGELVLSIDALRPKPRWLEIPTSDGEVATVKIPGNLSLDTMLEMRAIEAALRDPNSTDGGTMDELLKFSELIGGIITRNNPGMDDVRLELGIVEATRLLVFLAQPNDDLASAFVEALTAGGGEKPDAASDDARKLARAAGLEDGDVDGKAADKRPLRSTRRSSGSSSRSASSTTGRRSGGSAPASRGKRSRSTSPTRSKGSASAKKT